MLRSGCVGDVLVCLVGQLVVPRLSLHDSALNDSDGAIHHAKSLRCVSQAISGGSFPIRQMSQ